MSTYISTSCLRNNSDIFSVLGVLVYNCIKNIELSSAHSYRDNIFPRLKDCQNKYGLNYLVHNYFPPAKEPFVLNIASSDSKILTKSRQLAKKSILLATKLGVGLYTIHAGYAETLKPEKDSIGYFQTTGNHKTPRQKSLEILLDSVRELCEFAAKRRVSIGIENMFPVDESTNVSIMCRKEEFVEMFERLSSYDNLGVLIDFGHLNVSSHYLGFSKYEFLNYFFDEVPNRIFAVHISENDGTKDQHLPISKDSWILDYLRERAVKTIPVVFESRDLEVKEIQNQYEQLEEVFHD